MQGGTLQSQPLVATASFNWVFLVELIVCGILAIFFLFYFNRVFATLVSYGLRAYTWHYYKVYVDVHALQVSPLGGRIFFKGFRYHGENETVLIQQGYMTWRYWLRAVQKSEYLCTLDAARDRDEHGGNVSPDTAGSDVEHDQLGVKVTSKKLPSRLEITLHGVEWFIYNRTAAYDSILEGFGHQKPATDANKVQPDDDQEAFRVSSIPDIVVGDEVPSNIAREPRLSRRSTSMLSILHKCSSIKGHLLTRRTSTRTDSTSGEPFKSPVSGQSVSDAQSSGRSRADAHATAPQSSFLRLLPIDISCTKGAIVMGNENTQAILSTSFDSAEGKLDATNAGPEDCYKMMIDLDFSHPIVQMRPNPDFKHLQITVANKMRLSNDFRLKEERKRRHHWFRRKFIKAYHNVRDLVPYFQRSVESFHLSSPDGAATPPNRIPGMTRWQGLQRYREDEVQDEHEGWQFVEYGRCSVLLDVPSLHANYYWDVAGKVTYSPSDRERRCQQPPVCPINGSSPPDWGLHLALRGGNINYGPWADRQRIGVQRVFFPAFYRDTEPAKPLSPGDTRQATTFRVTLDFEKETVLRIPTREPSKDWLWKDRADAVRRAAKKRKERHKKHPREKETDKGGQSADIRPYSWISVAAA
ncbi:hypothetical protein KEM52_003976 [Ascosphaera acerosa]|nr:hypothetical protein KEM52_003976 [Ascosphaera acerosa]